MAGVEEGVARKALEMAAFKLPIQTAFIKRSLV